MTGQAVETVKPFHLEIGKLGCFPNLRRVQVVWVGIAGDLDPLQRLAKKLEANMAELGFPPEGRAFTPHLTLARIRDDASPDQRRALGEIVAGIKLESNLIFNINSISLMRSQLRPSGAVYTELHSFALLEKKTMRMDLLLYTAIN
jgi:2'-5' RNA ligase